MHSVGGTIAGRALEKRPQVQEVMQQMYSKKLTVHHLLYRYEVGLVGSEEECKNGHVLQFTGAGTEFGSAWQMKAADIIHKRVGRANFLQYVSDAAWGRRPSIPRSQSASASGRFPASAT